MNLILAMFVTLKAFAEAMKDAISKAIDETVQDYADKVNKPKTTKTTKSTTTKPKTTKSTTTKTKTTKTADKPKTTKPKTKKPKQSKKYRVTGIGHSNSGKDYGLKTLGSITKTLDNYFGSVKNYPADKAEELRNSAIKSIDTGAGYDIGYKLIELAE